jgi:hypothetical protein
MCSFWGGEGARGVEYYTPRCLKLCKVKTKGKESRLIVTESRQYCDADWTDDPPTRSAWSAWSAWSASRPPA